MIGKGVRVLLALAVAAVCAAQQARLLVQKTMPNGALVFEKNSTIQYVIINNGDAAATGVLLEDQFDTTAFAAIPGASPGGTVSHLLDAIAPGAKQVISQDVVPLMQPGGYVLPRAVVSYTVVDEDGEAEERRVYSTTLRARVLTHKQYLKENAKSGLEWLILLGAYAVAGLGPFYVWFQSRKRNEQHSTKKKSS